MLRRTASSDRPQNERPIQDHGDEGNSLRAAPLESNERKEIIVGGKEEV